MSQSTLLEDLSKILSKEGINCLNLKKLSGGTNNQAYRLETKERGMMFVKRYFQDDRKRLEHEYTTLDILFKHGFAYITKPLFRLDNLQCGIYEFVEGHCLPSKQFTKKHINKVVEFLVNLHKLPSTLIDYPGFNAMSSLGEWRHRLTEWRIASFNQARSQLHPLVLEFEAKEHVINFVEQARDDLRAEIDTIGLDPKDQRISPIDFSPGNMLWRADESFTEIDWEYGGLDHALRIIGDFYAHDMSHEMGLELRQYFLDQYKNSSPLSEKTLSLLPLFIKLVSIEWIMVQLNFMLPQRFERFIHSGCPFDLETTLQYQMQRVRERMAEYSQQN